MTDARDRAINALCDTIADLRKRIADLEMMAAGARPWPEQPYGKSAWERANPSWVGGQATPQPERKPDGP